jgi:hypothetical protein
MYQFPIRIRTAFLLALAILSCPQPLLAHHPIFTEDAATSPDTAIKIADPAISQVVYREITEESPQVWLTFQAEKDFKLFIQIGVPVIDRFKDFRPAMVVIGPGLPAEDAPFKLPENTGAKILTTEDVAKPSFFHEPFTNTDSWILRSESVTLPKAGQYYVVAYLPQKQTGKLWLSVGKTESFGPDDLKEFPTWTKRIQAFHEVNEQKIAHNVYFSLNDNSDAAKEKLVAACKKYLSGHSGTESFAVGRLAKDLKQPVNEQDFDVSIQFVFTNKTAFEKYSKSEKHLKFIEENKANWKKVRVFDSYLEP